MANSPSARSQDGSVLVVGAGVAGIRAALDLAEVGVRVVLVDASPAIGGLLQKLDHQFVDNHCGMCRMLPELGSVSSSRFCLRKGLFHDGIEILPFTTAKEVRGEPGAFVVTLQRTARWVDTTRCGDCSAPCVSACPISVPDEFNQRLTRRKAIYWPVPHGDRESLLIDRDACDRCGKCEAACLAGAIDLGAADVSQEVEVDAVILAAGASIFRARQEEATKHLDVSPNVVTALDLERMLGVAGPRRGHLTRPSDGKRVQRVAWIQCVGSRDKKHDRDVCSSVCCMVALKEAMLVRSLDDAPVEATIFYMDIRGFGKDFERYRRSAEQSGVRLIRSRVSDVVPTDGGGLRIRYAATKAGVVTHEVFDLVVLSTGLRPNEELAPWGLLLGWKASAGGFVPTGEFDKTQSPAPGVYCCGSVAGPTDIAASIVSATAAASGAHRLLGSLGRSFRGLASRQNRAQVDKTEARLLVAVCRCHLDVNGADVDTEGLRAELGVDVVALDAPCQSTGREKAISALRSIRADRVVLGGCAPHGARRRLSQVAQAAGFELSDVRVVDARRGAASIAMEVAALRTLELGVSTACGVARSVLVVGGGLAGMRATLSLAERGVPVHLLEKQGELGGRFAQGEGLASSALGRLVGSMRKQIVDHGLVTVHLGAEVVSSRAVPGRRDTTVVVGGGEQRTIAHGATIIATGGRQAATKSYGYGTNDRILTQAEFEQRLASDDVDVLELRVVVMIQCVDSRGIDSRRAGGHPYCSRTCCIRAIRNAEKIRAIHPEARVFVVYRDMMTTGALEAEYSAARNAGVMFIPYTDEHKPKVEIVDRRPVLTVVDATLGRPLAITADAVVLSTAIEPDASSAHLAKTFGLLCNTDGFFVEADAKWRPVDFAMDGMYVAGTALAPQSAREVLAQAEAAAHRAFTMIARPVVTYSGAVAAVHDAFCSRCQACLDACCYHARSFDSVEARIVVDPAACRGCGLCTTACPNGATSLGVMGERQVMATLEVALRDVGVSDRVRKP